MVQDPEIQQTPVDLQAVRLLASFVDPPVAVADERADPIWLKQIAPRLHAMDWTRLNAVTDQLATVVTPAGERARELLQLVREFKAEGEDLKMPQ